MAQSKTGPDLTMLALAAYAAIRKNMENGWTPQPRDSPEPDWQGKPKEAVKDRIIQI